MFPRPCFVKALQYQITMLVSVVFAFGFVHRRVEADLIAYNSSSAFNTATALRASRTIIFEGPRGDGSGNFVDGDIIGPNPLTGGNVPIQGILFDPSNAVAGNLIVTNGTTFISSTNPQARGLVTESGLNYLGWSIGDLIFQPFTFNIQPVANTFVNGVGMFVISDSELSSNDVTITVNGVTSGINLGTLNTRTGLVSSYSYFIGIAETNLLTNFSTVSIGVSSNIGTGLTGFGLDNISYTFTAVPEPSSLLLGAAAMAGVAYRARRRYKPNAKRLQ